MLSKKFYWGKMNNTVQHIPNNFIRILIDGIFNDSIELNDILGKNGNLKVPSTTAIFNMSSARDCPSFKLGLCKAYDENGNHICYAKRSENSSRPGVLPYRRRQEKYWLKCTPERFCVEFLSISAIKINPFTALRFNESGDFHSQKDVQKAEKIARILKRYGIVCYCYTSRDDLDYSMIETLRISGSGFKKPGVVNIFKIIKNKESKPRGYGLCIQDCRKCNRCLRAGLKTAIIQH